ncbi:hypothetical protein [Microbacterium pumilum]|uniref:hypothetical protein n=1 Tax=Microbacterium pumilum TaxID=344165 RepID=UPI0031D33175
MTLQVRLAVLRAHHDASYPALSDQACWEMLIENPNGTAVMQYWTEVTQGHLQFTATMFPWVSIDVYDPEMERPDQLSAALDATRRVTDDLFIEYDGFVLLMYPGVVQVPGKGQQGMTDAGAVGFDPARMCAVLHYGTRDHTFMAHEVGHVLGFEHSFGLVNTGMDWDGLPPWTSGTDYGDPYDVMSSGSFGRCDDPLLGVVASRPWTQIASPAGWVVTPTQPGLKPLGAPTVNAGPAPALAHVDWRYPEALGRSVSHGSWPSIGQPPLRVRLYAADHAAAGTRLLALHPPAEPESGIGRVYLEYRRPAGWDAGYATRDRRVQPANVVVDLARQAVVAHTVGLSYVGPRIWYRGRILMPLTADTDMQISTTPLSVRAVASGDDWVDLEVVHGTDTGIALSVRREDVLASETVTGVEHTPCGDRVDEVNRLFRTTMSYLPAVRGFDGNTPVTWRVGGRVATPPAMMLDTADGESRIEVDVAGATQELTLRSARGHHYNVEVMATVTEPGGTVHTASEAFDPTGSYVGIAPEDQGLLDECWQKWAKSKRLEPFQQLRVRDQFRRTPQGRRVLEDESLESVLVEVLGRQRVDDLEPAAREALEKLVELGLR